MPLFRKLAALLMIALAAFVAAGLVLATPALPAAVVLALVAALLGFGAFYAWPRRGRLPLVQALVDEHPRKPLPKF